MGLQTPSAQELYDLLLLGLTFVRREERTEDNDEPVKLKLASGSIFRGLAVARTIPSGIQSEIAGNWALMGVMMQSWEKAPGRMSTEALLARITASSERLIVMVPGGNFVSAGLLGRKAYSLAITSVGMRYADEVYPTYAEHITPDRFLTAWRQAQRSMRAMHARLAADQSKVM